VVKKMALVDFLIGVRSFYRLRVIALALLGSMCCGLKRFIHAIALVGKPGVMEFFFTARRFAKLLLRQI
jgi:hypothetical protein